MCALILGAGSSTRIGRPKQLIPINGQTVLERVIAIARAAGLNHIFLVLGFRAGEIISRTNLTGVRTVINTEFRKGLSSSLRAGLKTLPKQCGAAIILLGDMPFVDPETVRKLMEAYRTHHPLIVVPVHRGRRGNPVLFDRRLFSELAEVSGDQGGRVVISSHENEVLELEVENPTIFLDIDRESDLKKLSSGTLEV